MVNLINNDETITEVSTEPCFEKGLIYHCSGIPRGEGGGVERYLAYLLSKKLPDVSDLVLKSPQTIDQSQVKLLHIHTADLIWDLTGECATVFTAHNHSLYCPSGTKYLAGQRVVCDRNLSYLGCTWGKIVDGCGSRKPLRMMRELQLTHKALDIVKERKVLIIAPSDYIRNEHIKNGIPPQQVVTLHNAISVSETATTPLSAEVHKNHRILFAGRIVPDKGLEWLLRSLAETDERIHLDIAGDGWDRPRLERLANSLGLNKRITWHGWCASYKIKALYEQCFAVVFPSIWPEPAGLITLEAYTHYRPVIASAVGGIPEYIQPEETGLLVPGNDIQKLAQAITELDTDYEKCRHMGEQGHALFMKKFTMDIHIQGLQKLYEKSILEFYPS
ncbi:glycosyltransferase [Scytonema sp. UIC 10036]|uniref:glycosyltransferase family 4 protein n=1 Tax=Scytonema sp. UIC 10036 TaxID=2304196 RepID=UPI0012DA2CA4|nr:glycosyltransferase family 4 protein [Scytonema sp. UIC 10036]MUG96402.1 glycosyltransferase [Scytonema sp. UIC 10036]